MTEQFIPYVVSQWAEFFGSPGLLALVLIGLLVLILLASRAGKTVIALVIIPLMLTFGAATSSVVGISHWISISLWLIIGLVFFGMWTVILR